MAVQPLRSIFQIKVTLKGIKPPVWRRLLVLSSLKLSDFHRVLQCAMGWCDLHLHQFTVGRQLYGIPETDWPDDTLNERRFTVGNLLTAEEETLLYEYDFGDGWEHKIVLEKIMPFDKGIDLPQCLKGKRACPPEDVGGPRGYQDFLDAINDSEHPEHEGLLEWVGGEFDPEYFDAVVTTQTLHDSCWNRGT
jgi:hypothetical protein